MSPILGSRAGVAARGFGMFGSSTAPWSPAGAYDALATITVPTGGVASVTFAGIPAGYKHLQIRYMASDNNAGTYTDAIVRFNGDSSSSYSWHQLLGDGSSASAYSSTSQTSLRLGVTPGTSVSGVFGATIVDILDYTSTSKNKTIRNLAGADGNGSGQITLNSGSWFPSTIAAISSLIISPRVGSLFNQNSQFALYGVK